MICKIVSFILKRGGMYYRLYDSYLKIWYLFEFGLYMYVLLEVRL